MATAIFIGLFCVATAINDNNVFQRHIALLMILVVELFAYDIITLLK